jgi:very-short-patch-repair endonuclease
MKRKTRYKECPKCKELIGTTAFNRHVSCCDGTLKGLRHPTRKVKNAKGRTEKWYESQRLKKASNQYMKARELGLPVPVMSEDTKRKIVSSHTGKPLSDEHKKKISVSRTLYLEKNPDKVPYIINHSSKGPSYPEKYWIELIKKENLNLYYHKRVGIYELDFFNEEVKLNLEIDGEQHYLDTRIVESDITRNVVLSNLGWKTIRIRWSVWQKLSFMEKQIFIEYIRSLLTNFKPELLR